MYPYTISKSSITVCIDGSSTTVSSGTVNYEAVKTAIKENNWETIPALLKPAKAVEHLSGGEFKINDGLVSVRLADNSFFECPEDLSKQIIFYMDEGLDFQPLVKFAQKLNDNPSYHAVNQLFTWINKTNLTITPDGNFIAYKGVREDMRDHYTGTIDNSVGITVKMIRNQVDENPLESCSAGLHVATYNYAHHHYGPRHNGKVIYVEVNPKDVVAVPTRENDKMRVCEYKVLGFSEAPFEERILEPQSYDCANQFGDDETCDEDSDPCSDTSPNYSDSNSSYEDFEEWDSSDNEF